MKVIIDRFEGDFAIVELDAGVFVNMPRALVPAGAGEGSVISIEVDPEATNGRRESIKKLMKDVWVD